MSAPDEGTCALCGRSHPVRLACEHTTGAADDAKVAQVIPFRARPAIINKPVRPAIWPDDPDGPSAA